ncbi:transposon Ty3-I Gag-Pol polyprotein [Trichonephila clavata]|uniref:Transposon Ty3-I Gag-Pol polyprotein n=1 Tax=Trichonephila clavata TaxID=2740835 RepID=A0A8X6H5S4_TRICU|nr:transposon Ty3-I Gag-Pol polyprotein [Trichonephila clavata]
MPSGLCNAPGTFKRIVDNLLRHFKWSTCLDDIIVFSETFENHLIRLERVLKCLQEAGLVLNPYKCLFAAREIKILGHLAEPLQLLLKVDAKFHWGPEEIELLESLKRAFTSTPVLGMYDENTPTEIHTDVMESCGYQSFPNIYEPTYLRHFQDESTAGHLGFAKI